MAIDLMQISCSCMTLLSKSGKNYWFRTCDIDTDIWAEGAHIVSFPRKSLIAFENREAAEEVCYEFMGITNNEQDTWIMDGVNEKGLVGGLLLLHEGTSVPKTLEKLNGYVGMEIVTKMLSVCADVEEVKELARKMQVLHIPVGEQQVLATMHYFFADKNGNEVVMEAADKEQPGIFRIYDKQETIGIMTNSPTYDKQLANLSWYLAKSPELSFGINGNPMNTLSFAGKQVTIVRPDAEAEHLLRSDTFPASYCAYERFVRLSVLKALNDSGTTFTDEEMLALGSGIMSSVYEPRSKGIYHYTDRNEKGIPQNQKDSFTQYLVMYDIEEGLMYIKVFDAVLWVEYSLKKADKNQMKRYTVRHDGMEGIRKGN